MTALLAISLLASRYILPRPFAWAARSPEVLLVWALSWCFLLVLAAHAFGLSLEVGAFLAGLGLAQLPCNDDLRRRVHPLMNLFIAVFFVSLGIRMEAGGAAANWWPTLVLALFVLIGNPFIFMIIIRRMGYDKSTSFLTSVTVAQISEFSFIFAGMGLSRGLIGAEILSITALVGVVTIAVSAYMILYNRPLLKWCDKMGILDWRVFAPGREVISAGPSAHGLSLSGHVIVVGMNTLGRRIVRELHERGETVLAVDTELLVSALRIEETNDLLAYRCQSAGIPSAVHVVDLSVVDNLLDLGTDYMMIPKVDGVKAQLKKLRAMNILKS
jgi:hypothetical protein